MNRYKSDYPNQVHQLVITVSKHFYVKKDGMLGWQKKAFDVSLNNQAKSNRNHLVHCLIRDHFSGAFYCEVANTQFMPDAVAFLHRAWSLKDHHPFCGIPQAITIPKTVLEKFPNVPSLTDSLGIHTIKVTSGFQSGVRDIRTWEEYIRTDPALCGENNTFSNLKNRESAASIFICSWNSRGKSKLKVWTDEVEKLYIPPPLNECL